MKTAALTWPQNNEQHTGSQDHESLASFLAEYGIHHIADIRHMSNAHDQQFIPLGEIDRLVRRLSVDESPNHRLLPLLRLPSVFADQTIRENPVITNDKGDAFTLLYAYFHEEQFWITVSIHKKRSFTSKIDHHALANLRNLIGQLRTPLYRRVLNTFGELLKTPSPAP